MRRSTILSILTIALIAWIVALSAEAAPSNHTDGVTNANLLDSIFHKQSSDYTYRVVEESEFNTVTNHAGTLTLRSSDQLDWATGFNLPAANGRIDVAISDADGNLYVGGSFTAIGDIEANNIAKWDGSNWTALGSGVSHSSYPAVNALAVDENGTLFVGGQFTEAGGSPISYIAQWDDGSWSSINGELNSSVQAMAFDENGDLFVAGSFSIYEDGVKIASRIARWDGAVWSPLGDGVNSSVYDLAIDSNQGAVYASGFFSEAGGKPANRIAKWDGSTWSALGEGIKVAVDSVRYFSRFCHHRLIPRQHEDILRVCKPDCDACHHQF